MAQLITQYVLLIFIILGFGYIIYLLQTIKNDDRDGYFGLPYSMLNILPPEEATPENIKKIVRAIANAVNYVEENNKDEENSFKEDKALILAKGAIEKLDLGSTISDENIRHLLRLISAILPDTNKIV